MFNVFIFVVELNESHINWLCNDLMVRLGLMIRQAVTLELALIDTLICMFIHISLVLMEYMELSVIQSLLESTPSHACELMETSNCHSGRCFCSTWVQIHF